MNNVRNAFRGEEGIGDFLSIVKLLFFGFCVLLYFMNYNVENWIGTMILVCIFLICCAIWIIFFIRNKGSGFILVHKKMIQAIDSFIFVGFLTILIWLSNMELSEYKLLLLFIVIISTLQSGVNYGICIASISSLMLFLTDYVYMLKYDFQINFANDIVTCVIYMATAWVIGYYVKMEDKYIETKDVQFEIDMKKNIELLSGISHDLKTPLNVIFAALQMLYTCKNCVNKKIIDKHEKYVDVMKQNCYRLMKMINTLLDVTKINSGTLRLNAHNIDIVSSIESIVDSVIPYAEGKNINMIFDTDVEEKIMAVDIDKIERIMLNLISNSMKFTKDRGKIVVDFKNKGSYVLISVEDNGIGIPEGKLDMIFQQFSQVENLYRGGCEGSGIGLYLVKSFVELHGGEISVESSYGRGSKFTVKLPVNTIKEDHPDNNMNYGTDKDKINVEFSDITL
ncbi:sensor histidine kinase [Clostridium sp. LBM24168]